MQYNSFPRAHHKDLILSIPIYSLGGYHGEISGLKKTLPNLNGSKTVKDDITAAQVEEEVDMRYMATLRAILSLDG